MASFVLKKLDKDGDGQITEQDFILIANEMGFGKLGEKLMKTLFKAADKNKNGILDTREVMDLLNKLKGIAMKGGSSGTH